MGPHVNPDTMAFANKLATLRQKYGWSMRRLAHQVGTSYSHISLLERGKRCPSRPFIEDLAKALGPYINEFERDELLLAGGYTPIHFRNFTNREDVLTIYKHTLEKNPQDFKTFVALVITLIKTNQFALAAQYISEGFSTFENSLHMQALLAILELNKGKIKKAIAYQKETLASFIRISPELRSMTQLRHEDLLLNLGVMYFMRGYEYVDQKIEAESNQNRSRSLKYYKKALESLKTASDYFLQALKIAPDDIYILDEYARVNFNLAYLLPFPKAKPFWKKAIVHFREVLTAENKYLLGYDNLVQSNIFLAHAYAKSTQFADAEFHLNVIDSCLPQNWLVSYVKACYYCLKYEHQPSENLLDRALSAFHKAAAIQGPYNRTCSEGLVDPDLAVLRQHRSAAFQQIIDQAGRDT